MALTAVKISEETYLTCLTHALSTETEEIMGLLLGDIEYSDDGSGVALVWWAAPQTRSDRRKDRVETNPEQLAAASAKAEKMSAEIGRTTRVIGWYHSHPHITVMPSHVDVRTQGMYQMLDPGFVGLIFSCFSEDANKVGRIQVIAFQSQDGQRRDVTQLRAQSGVATNLGGETTRAAPITPVSSSSDLETTSTKVGAGMSANKQASALESLFAVADSEVRSTSRTSTAEDESLIMQEAMHLSTLEASGAEFVRREIHLDIVPVHSLVRLNSPFAPLVELQRILFEEEQAAFRQAIAQSTVNGKIHPLAILHHEAQYQATLSKLMEYCLCPAISCLSDKLHQNQLRIVHLHEEAQAIQLQRVSITSKGSPSSPQSVRRSSSQRTGSASSSSGVRPHTDVSSPVQRRSFGNTSRALPEVNPSPDKNPDNNDFIRF